MSTNPTSDQTDDIKQRLLLALGGTLILVGTCLIYWPGLHGPFVFDDVTNIATAPALRIMDLDFATLRDAAFWQKSSSLGRPIAMLSFALNYYFTQFDPFYFKLTNLAIHLGNGVLLYWLCWKLLGRLQFDSQKSVLTRNQRQWYSLAIAAIWLTHPLNLTSVLYVVQRMTSLSTLFTLLGLMGYVLGREYILKGKIQGFAITSFSLVSFSILATFSKENGVLLPLYILVVEIYFFQFKTPQNLRNTLKWYWATIIVTPLLLATGIFIIKPDALIGIFNYQYRDFSLDQRLLTETRALWFYLRLILIPDIRLMGIYHDDFPVSTDILTPYTTPFAASGILVLGIVAIIGFRKARVLSFAIAWFLAGHCLESSFIPLELVHEHRNYLPQFGILFALVYYLTYPYVWLKDSLRFRQGLFIFYLTLLSGVTYARAHDWKDEWTMYSRDVINHPESASAHTMLGIILHDNNQHLAAEFHFLRASQLESTDSKVMLRLAQHIYTENGEIPENVLKELERRLQSYSYSGITLWTFEPLLRNTLKNPVLNLRLIHMYEQLINRKDIVLLNDFYQSAYSTLAFTYRERKDYKIALMYFDKALELKPEPAYYLSKGEIYIKLGKLEDASRMLISVEKSNMDMNQDERLRKENLAAAIKYASQKRKAPNRVNN